MVENDNDFFILHGEDDECDVRVMKVLLDKIGYKGQYHQLATGDALVDWIDEESKPPGLLLLDIGLPGIDGKELLATFRNDPQMKFTPIIMMSGSSSERDYEECIALGANAYIQKTANIDELAMLLECFIEGWIRLSKQHFF